MHYQGLGQNHWRHNGNSIRWSAIWSEIMRLAVMFQCFFPIGWGKGAIFGDFHGENDEKFQKPLEVDADGVLLKLE